MSSYEHLRLRNIERNNAILDSLQIQSNTIQVSPLRSESGKLKISDQDAEPRRRSARNIQVTKDYIVTNVKDEETTESLGAIAKRQKKILLEDGDDNVSGNVESKVTKQKKPPPAASTDTKSSRNMIAEIELLKSVVGCVIPGGTVKAGVMRFVSPKLEPKFNKYSGVLEWQNTIFLMLNVAGNHYHNTFELDGRDLTVNYFLNDRTAPDAPILSRIASSPSTATTLHLFCRAADASHGPPAYVYFGRLGYRHHCPLGRPVRVRLALLDHAAVRAAPAALRLLDMAGFKG